MTRTFVIALLSVLVLCFGSTAFASHYELVDIDLVAPEVQEKLAAAGIRDTATLLDKVVSAQGRTEVAKIMGYDKPAIDRLARLLELMQITGIGPKAARLLLEAGINSVTQLATANPTDLLAMLVEVNAAQQITGVDPDEEVVLFWIAKAADAKVMLQ